ncbi:DUF1802 family protein [Nostoc parmelioides]|uniref:DUF1802 family protein n=1 Tax=Nostoc parmelioides FACHB-3921 TaxID=2692909 RepID=A0ABR8BNC0_9NOSO|nr:DUF1802 family protein [Nostoc parmelioides]MBD2255438.1 DUF1802 family protein [Nostoc parmelioides FACHB-3921]
MNNSIVIYNALSLPAPDVEALIQGRMIAAMPQKLINSGQNFALYSTSLSTNLLPKEEQYQSNFLPFVQALINDIDSEKSVIKAWARCEWCQMLDKSKSLKSISCLTIWTTEALEVILAQRPYIFLAYLRVYLLSEPQEIDIQNQSRHFVPLPSSLTVTEDNPVLSDRIFAQRRQQLEKLEPPQHPELEELQSALTQISNTNPAAKELDDDIRKLLGWSSDKPEITLDSDLAWIEKIAEVGNSSDGQTFEKLVRRGLLKLGFTGSGMNPDATGGAGGMDFYAEAPFPIVGECKATKTEKVSDGTPAQLLKIGLNHLGKFQYENAIKLIVASGELNNFALRTATEHQMNVIRPETLQKLVELQTHHKNSINLLELKEYLRKAPFGLADDKVNSYIDKVGQNIKLRSHIIQVLRNYLELTKYERAGVEALHAAYITSNPPQPLESKELHEILIELSSPLTGYLGRIKGSDWRNDRFYYLRDLPINSK